MNNKYNLEIEIEKLARKYRNTPKPLLLINREYSDTEIREELDKVKRSIDRSFNEFYSIDIINAFVQNDFAKLCEEDVENLKNRITEARASLMKRLQKNECYIYTVHIHKNITKEYIAKPALTYLLEKKYKTDKLINRIRRTVKKISVNKTMYQKKKEDNTQ